MTTLVLTLGHSSGRLEQFVDLLGDNDIATLVDVRSVPASGYAPQFGQHSLQRALLKADIEYLFMGRELGGRPQGAEFYDEAGYVLYYRRARSEAFRSGLERLIEIAADHRTAIMCSEEDPTNCHRHLLIARVLAEQGVAVKHLRHDGSVQPYAAMADVRHRAAQTESLFADTEDTAWRSTRSVSPRGRPRASSAH